MNKVLVTGAGGFIGHHLVTFPKASGILGSWRRSKASRVFESDADEFLLLDLRRWENCLTPLDGVEEVYALAADMGGMGFISAHHAEILHNNSLINIHTLDAAREKGGQTIPVLIVGVRLSRNSSRPAPMSFRLRKKTPIRRSRRMPMDGRSW